MLLLMQNDTKLDVEMGVNVLCRLSRNLNDTLLL